MPSHDMHRDDRDSGDANEKGNRNTGKEKDKFDEMAGKKAGPNLGLDEKNPNLCSTCRKRDFNSLFGSHDCEINVSPEFNMKVLLETHQPSCRCGQKIIPSQLWSSQFGYSGLLGKLDSHVPACSFCAFLHQCQVRLNLTPTKQKQWYYLIRPCLSLESIIRQSPIEKPPFLLSCVQDVAALQMCKLQKIERRGKFQVRPIPQSILRVVDSGGRTLTRNKRVGGGLLGRKLDPNKVDLNLIREWLTLCRSTHPHCEDVDADRIPGLLVVDCTTDHVVPLPLKQDAANQVEDYVALSYLWGTAEATGGSVVQSINCDGDSGLALPAQIPLVISDAIRVVKQLGYRYLWVDRYCIPQEDRAAKHIQILNMGKIYSNSILTIIAAAGDGPDYGLPGVSSRPRLAQVGVQISDEISLVLYKPPTDHITNSKWNTRGWTYQEGLLSKRRLVFTDVMVYFQCQEMHGDEVLSLPIPGLGEDCDEIRPLSIKHIELGMVFPKVTDWGDPMTAWQRLGEYGPRELGYDSDALNAISGVMEMYALAAGDSVFKLFCGLPILPMHSWAKYALFDGGESWKLNLHTWFSADVRQGAWRAQRTDGNLTDSLVYSLCWRNEWGEAFELPASFEGARRELFGSWTAAGWRTRKSKPGEINYFDSCMRISVQYSSELSLDWEDDNPRILDLSRKGKMPLSLNITGLVMDVRIEWQRHPFVGGEGWALIPPSASWGLPLKGAPRWLFEEAISGKGNSSKLVFLILGCYLGGDYGSYQGLILRPVTRSSEGEARIFYERLDSRSIEVNIYFWRELASLTRKMEVRLI